jgi:hypothetical protein
MTTVGLLKRRGKTENTINANRIGKPGSEQGKPARKTGVSKKTGVRTQ